MRAYLLLRITVLRRELRDLGWWRLLVLGSLLLFIWARLVVLLATHPGWTWLAPALPAVLLWSLHRQRPDYAFLHLTAPKFRQWLAAEYGLWSLLLALPLLGWGRGGPAGATLAVSAAVAWVPVRPPAGGRQRARSWFRSVAFEWVGGLRHPGLALAWLALLGGAAASWQTSTGPALAVLAWLLLVTNVYGPAEPWTWLLPALRTPGAWLRRRAGWGLLYFCLTVAPLATVLVLGPAGVGGTVLVLAWCAVVLTMVVLAKYAFYPHATLGRLTQGGAVAAGLSVLGSNPAYGAFFAACFLGLLIKSYRRLAFYCPPTHD